MDKVMQFRGWLLADRKRTVAAVIVAGAVDAVLILSFIL